MSVWYTLVDEDGKTVELTEPLTHEGGTYVLGGSYEAELNVTYNYAQLWAVAAGPDFEGMLDGFRDKRASDTAAMLERIVTALGDAPGEDYWEPTPGNAGHAASLLLMMAREHPEARWHVSG